MLGYDEVEEVVIEGHERLKEHGPSVEFEGFDIDYDNLSDRVLEIFGKEGTACWLAGFHAALCLAMRYWEYRIPKKG